MRQLALSAEACESGPARPQRRYARIDARVSIMPKKPHATSLPAAQGADARESAPDSVAPAALWIVLAALARARGIASSVHASWAWGLASQRFVPTPLSCPETWLLISSGGKPPLTSGRTLPRRARVPAPGTHEIPWPHFRCAGNRGAISAPCRSSSHQVLCVTFDVHGSRDPRATGTEPCGIRRGRRNS